ncbi:Protein kinase-like [Zostera marina]|uniref:Protein kinase-like n=1 Tax=Zostera marina TaxID=29655 RepID=A0A0K9PP77_ZOSMR|nr:Protein kinase-like [Zostera marina]
MPTSSSTNKCWTSGGFIGQGSFGSVNLAYNKASGNIFAVKSVPYSTHSYDNSSLQSLENEIMIYRSIKSPYVLSYIDDDVTCEFPGGDVFRRNLHLEYMVNGTVSDFAKKISTEYALRSYTRCLTEALRYLTGVGIVHGDVKGKNVLVGDDSRYAKLADFGSARRLSDGARMEVVLQGTPLWMAPEVARGEPNSAESDIWSLGCTVIEMVTGKAPWTNWKTQSPETALFKIGFGEEMPELPTEMSELGRNFVGKCLRRNPEERWSSEQLLDHPFLAEEITEQSPRSVFGSGTKMEKEDNWNGGTNSDNVADTDDARRRIMEIANVTVKKWEIEDNEHWDVVRGQDEEDNSRDGKDSGSDVLTIN